MSFLVKNIRFETAANELCKAWWCRRIWRIGDATKKVAEKILEQGGLVDQQAGVYHFTCQGQTSWAEFAKAIFVENEISSITVNGITTEEYPTPAKRPAFSVLNGEKLKRVFGVSLPDWGTALAHCAAETKAL